MSITSMRSLPNPVSRRSEDIVIHDGTLVKGSQGKIDEILNTGPKAEAVDGAADRTSIASSSEQSLPGLDRVGFAGRRS
jgi:hypothetical protein